MDRGIAAVDRDHGSVHTKVAPGLRRILLHITKLEARHEGGAVRYIITVTSDGGRDADVRRRMLDRVSRSACNPRSKSGWLHDATQAMVDVTMPIGRYGARVGTRAD